MPQLHVTLVTGRPEANLIPLLQLKPEWVCLVASERMTEAAERLYLLLKDQLPTGTHIQVRKGLPDTEPQAISQYAFALADELEASKSADPGLTITYDLTGGTKLMALLFQEAMRCCDAEMIYTNSDTGCIYHMGAELQPDSFRSEAIESVLDANLYLHANGKRLLRSASDEAAWQEGARSRKALTKHLARHAAELDGLTGQLNYLIQVSQGDKPAVILEGDRQTGPRLNDQGWQQSLSHPPGGDWKKALRLMNEAGVLEWSPSAPRELRFPFLDGALYLSGGWLEEYAWHCARDAGLEDVHCSAQILDETGRKSDVRNEFDCLVVHRNRMLIFECKTARMKVEERDQQVLHKLNSLTEQSAGLYGTRVLLTSGTFGSKEHRDTNLKRAQSMQVKVTEGADLKQLPEQIKGWMETGHWPG